MVGRQLYKAFLGALIAIPLAFGVPTSTAEATSLAPLTVEQLTDASDYIIRGEVVETWTEVDDNGLIWTRARVDVSETLKGPTTPDELVIDSMGGEYAGQTLTIEGRAVYSKHEELLVFLSQTSSGRFVPVAKFLGKYSIRRAPDVNRQYALTWHPGEVEFDARFLPHPKAEDRVYLDGLLDTIQTRLDTGWDGKPIPGISADRLRDINTPERRMR